MNSIPHDVDNQDATLNFQGPALMSFNNAMFTEDDWKSIQMLNYSAKSEDPHKIGRHGVGFASVYHITGFVIETVSCISKC